MCGRYQFTTGSDDMSAAIVDMLERRYPGEYKTGEDGFAQFWPDEDQLKETVLQLFYQQIK